MRKKKQKKVDEGAAGKKRVDRFLLFLLTCTSLTFALWAVLASLLAFHFRTKSEMAQVNLRDSREAMADVKSSSDSQRQSAHNELIHAEILRAELSSMFRQLLLAEERPDNFAQFMTTLQTLFGELSGETMSRMDMISLKKTLSELLSVVPKSARPPARIIKERVDVKKASAALVAEEIILPNERLRVEQALTRLMNGEPPKGLTKGAPAPKAPVAKKPTPAVKTPAQPAKVAQPTPEKAKPAPVAPPVKKPVPPKPKRKEFVDKKNGYRVSFPLDWSMKEDADSSTVLARSPRKDFSQLYTPYVIITAQKSEAPLELETFTAKGVERVEQSLGEYEEIQRDDVALAGLPAKRRHLKFERLGRGFEATYIFCIKGDVGYMFSFTVPEDQVLDSKEQLEAVVASFKFL